jgi:hypothetical protein
MENPGWATVVSTRLESSAVFLASVYKGLHPCEDERDGLGLSVEVIAGDFCIEIPSQLCQ